jgi:Beta-galactosidase
VAPVRHALVGLALALGVAAPGAAVQAPAPAADRAMGRVFDWSHELNQEELPEWDAKTAPPIAAARWYRTIDSILSTAGRDGLWFSGFGALPFDIPLHPKEPKAWRNPANFARQYRATGLSWDVNLEARAAKNALRKKTAVISDPGTDAPTRRLSLLDPGYRSAALAEIRRLVPRYADLPYVYAYTGSDEPLAVLPRGAKALSSPFARRLAREVRSRYGYALPKARAKPTANPVEGLRWLAYSRYVSDRFFDLKAEQARLIRSLDPDARVIPNDYGFIDGFMPWDYTRLSAFADELEADPYVSYAEAVTPGRGRYNPGFTAKLLSDLTGKPVRIVIQAFPYANYAPRPADLYAWTAQALRAGATDISFYAQNNPRFTNRRMYDTMLAIARSLRGTRLPAPPADPSTVVVYATASEGQGQPLRKGDARYRTGGDALYTTYALLGELAGGSFVFDADTRLAADPTRLARARTIWLPRGDTLDRAFADRLVAWVQGGGTLVVTDPRAFTRAPDGTPLTAQRDALIGAGLGPRRTGDILLAEPDGLTQGLPADLYTIPVSSTDPRAFDRVPAGAKVLARFIDDAPAAIVRTVGRGRVIAFAADPMTPESLDQPYDLVSLVSGIEDWLGTAKATATWAYRVPGAPTPDPLPWEGAQVPPWALAATASG